MAYLGVRLRKLRKLEKKTDHAFLQQERLWYKQLVSSDVYVDLAVTSTDPKNAEQLLKVAATHGVLADRSQKETDKLLKKLNRITTRRIKTERKLAKQENN